MRQYRSSGSVEGVVGNHDSYSNHHAAGAKPSSSNSTKRVRERRGPRPQSRVLAGLRVKLNHGLNPSSPLRGSSSVDRPGFAPRTWARRILLPCGLARPGRARADASDFALFCRILRQYTRRGRSQIPEGRWSYSQPGRPRCPADSLWFKPRRTRAAIQSLPRNTLVRAGLPRCWRRARAASALSSRPLR